MHPDVSLDDQSIKDIAQTFGISENTVKSRLLYGRKSHQGEGRGAPEKGYQLYTVAPVVLFLYCFTAKNSLRLLWQQQSAAMEAQRGSCGKSTDDCPGRNLRRPTGCQNCRIRRKESGKAAARRDVYSNCSRKILIGVAVVGVLGGGAVTAVHYLGQQQEQEVAVASANMEVLPTGAQETAPTVMPTASADDEIILTPEPEADDEIILTPEPEADDEIILTPEPESDDEIILMPEPGEGRRDRHNTGRG